MSTLRWAALTAVALLVSSCGSDAQRAASAGHSRGGDLTYLDAEAPVDGVNIRYITTPGSFEDFIDHVVPELQSRGLAQTEYAPGTLRDKLFGDGPTLPDRHPARAWRGQFSSAQAVSA